MKHRNEPGVTHSAKRALDAALAATALLAASPALLAGGIAVRLSMGRPVLFRQQRPGLKGRPFSLLKLRTMHDRWAPDGTPLPDSARLSRVGAFLRATSVDELPQLWNVLKGELSLVGPRPLLMQYLDRYTPTQARRHEVKPGITGWAQVNGRNTLSWEQKFELDVWYVDNWSLWLDIKILALTVLKVFKRDGISNSSHATMPEFKGPSSSTGATGDGT